jgi:hypothetical protein
VRKTLLVIAASLSLSFVHGCPVVNRYDPRPLKCCGDTAHYYQMVEGNYGPDVAPPFRYRPLVPAVARMFWFVVRDAPLGGWDRVFVALILADALFMALTAILIVRIAAILGLGGPAAMLAVFVHHTNFVSAHAYMLGTTDSAEAMFVSLAAWLCLTGRFAWLLPVIALAPLAKETTLVFTVVFSLLWVLFDRSARLQKGVQIVAGAAVGAVVLYGIRSAIGGAGYEAQRLSIAGIQRISASTVFGVLFARSLIYCLVPVAALILLGGSRRPPGTRQLWLALALSVAAAVLLAIYSGLGENVPRPVWAIAGWWLALWAADSIGRRFQAI